MKDIIQKIEALESGDGLFTLLQPPIDHAIIAETNITTDELKALAEDLETAKRALEHYADKEHWGDRYVHSGDWMDGYLPDDCHGYDIARACLDRLSGKKEK